MRIEVVKSKIHRVRVTQADLDYIGSITIDENLMKAANIIENEKVPKREHWGHANGPFGVPEIKDFLTTTIRSRENVN